MLIGFGMVVIICYLSLFCGELRWLVYFGCVWVMVGCWLICCLNLTV